MHGGGGGLRWDMAPRNPALSFRHGNWSLAVLLSPTREYHFGMGLDPPPRMGWGREWRLAADSLATLTGHNLHTKLAESGLWLVALGQVCSSWGPRFSVVCHSNRLQGKVAAARLAATWLGRLDGCGGGELGGPPPYPAPYPWWCQLSYLGAEDLGPTSQLQGHLWGRTLPVRIRRYHGRAGAGA